VIARAVGKTQAHRALQSEMHGLLDDDAMPAPFRNRLGVALDRAVDMAARIGAAPDAEALARQAATALYNAASAVLLAWEGSRSGADARRALYARCVLEHRLSPRDPLEPVEAAWEKAAIALVLRERAATWDEVAPLLAG
jgi:acyl-CoA dehydrogenase